MFVCLFVCHFVCTVMDFSAAEKDRGMKFCMHVRLVSGMSFSHFDELVVFGLVTCGAIVVFPCVII